MSRAQFLLAWTVPKNAISCRVTVDKNTQDIPISRLKVSFVKGKRVYTYAPVGLGKGSHSWNVIALSEGNQEIKATNAKKNWSFISIEKLLPVTKTKRAVWGKTRFIAGSEIKFLWQSSPGAASYEIFINDSIIPGLQSDSKLTSFVLDSL